MTSGRSLVAALAGSLIAAQAAFECADWSWNLGVSWEGRLGATVILAGLPLLFMDRKPFSHRETAFGTLLKLSLLQWTAFVLSGWLLTPNAVSLWPFAVIGLVGGVFAVPVLIGLNPLTIRIARAAVNYVERLEPRTHSPGSRRRAATTGSQALGSEAPGRHRYRS